MDDRLEPLSDSAALPMSGSRLRGILLLPACLLIAAGVVLLLIAATDLPREAAMMSGIFLMAALLWSTEALPPSTTALLVIAMQIILLANPGNWPGLGFQDAPTPGYGEIIRGTADPVILLFFGGLLLAQAAVVSGVDRTMARLILRPFGSGARRVLLGMMIITAIFSMWMSNTATTAMMILIVAPMLRRLRPDDSFRVALGLSVPFAANIGGMGTPIGSPPNAVAVGFLQRAGFDVGFLQWMLVAVPLMVGMLFVTWLLLCSFYPPQQKHLEMEHDREPMTPRRWFVVGVFVVTALLWLTEAWHGLPAPVVALLPVVLFMVSGVLRREHLNTIDWDILILIAGGLALGFGMQMTGLDEIIIGLLPQEGWLTGRPILAVAAVTTIVLSTFMSNTGAANVLLPIGVSFGMAAGTRTEPVEIAVSIALAASLAMALPVSTPPNAIAYARAGISTRQMAFVGSLLGMLGIVLIVSFGGPIIRFWHSW